MPVDAQLLRFGPFQLDTQIGQLRRDGVGLKLQGQPVQILEILLGRPGELVTREELRHRLWSPDTFVDFDHSLNSAMQRLRHALGDEAETPSYIETIPKRGYRFIGEVTRAETSEESVPSLPLVDETVEKIATTLADTAISDSRRSSALLRWRIAVIFVCALFLAIAGFYWTSGLPPVPRVVGSHALTKTGFRKGYGVFTDGTSIYFQENRPSHTALVRVRLAGGEASEIASLPDSTFLSSISNDGSELLFATLDKATNQFDAWVQPLPAGPARRVIKDAWAPAWTADYRGILFARNHHRELFRADADGSNPRRLAVFPDIASLQVSPDGRQVRVATNFVLTNAGLLQVDLMRPSSPQPVIADAQGDLSMGTWSPDGNYFFFLAWVRDRNDLWVMPEKRYWWQWRKMRPIQLTFGPVSLGPLALSTDGKHVYAAGLQRHGELAVYDHKSGEFVPYLSGISACYVDFSRDGQWIAYVSYPEGTLWRSRIDGSERRQLTVPPIGVMNPRWSPDGKLIAFTNVASVARHSVEEKKWQIYVVSADGGAPLLLLEGVIFSDPTWSSDGKSLAYGVGPIASAGLRILDLESFKSEDLPGSENLTSPRWSPDGKYLIALGLDYPAKKLMLYSFQSGKWEALASGAFDWPSWSHDSRYVYVQEANSLVRIAIASRKKEQVASLRGLHIAAYYFDRIGWGWFGLTPDDRPITLRDTGIEEIYAFDLEYK